ncbi:MAG: stage II sporulation protein M [Saprospiraceae bacterium]|nr:stage II sporulation protein M [Saprospiraceae bacterium]
MTETQFIEENKDHWEELEGLLNYPNKDPDRLHNLFVKVSSDLAYASTFYPKRSVRAYLNQLTQRVFDSMEQKKNSWSLESIKNFFGHILPREMFASRRALLISFSVFMIAVLIGIVSTAHDPQFPEIILGKDYIEQTERNISNDDPMAVYKDEEQSDMFLRITVNNVRVSFLCFIMGIFGSLGTIIILFHNGIMLGAFQYFFYTKGLFVESFMTIWIHGTIEISAIIIAGSAGIILGNGILFPKTFDRGTSVRLAATRSIRVLLGTTPLFFIAGFLESFITRLTDMPMIFKIVIIGGSLIFILGYYVFYPWWQQNNLSTDIHTSDIEPNETSPLEIDLTKYRNLSQNIYLGFAQFRINMGKYFSHAMNLLLVIAILSFGFYQWLLSPHVDYPSDSILLFGMQYGGILLFILYWLIITYASLIVTMIYRSENLSIENKMVFIKMHFINMMLFTFSPLFVCYYFDVEWMFLFFLFIPPQFLMYTLYSIPDKGWKVWSELVQYYTLSLNGWLVSFLCFAMTLILHGLITYSVDQFIVQFFLDFISWHDVFSGIHVTQVIIMTTVHLFIYLLLFPLYYYLFVNLILSEHAKLHASDLWKRLEIFSTQSKIFESKS